MDWFEKLTGFRETDYEQTRALLEVEGENLSSRVNGARHAIGELELVSLHDLRERATSAGNWPGRLRCSIVTGDMGSMHQRPENAGALFQVASQFNLLEMASPAVTPQDGVTRYRGDPTQGPACAIAAGAATIYRNYFVPVQGSYGQTATRQLDGLADLGLALSGALNLPIHELLTMRNGYALATKAGLDAIGRYLGELTPEEIDVLRSKLRIGIHRDAILNARRGASNVVFLTLLGGGAFGNDSDWIHAAIRRALNVMRPFGLDVRLVSYTSPSKELLAVADEFGE